MSGERLTTFTHSLEDRIMGFDWLVSWLGGGDKSRGPSRRVRLSGERLEDRWVPDGTRFLWEATLSNTWEAGGNWSYETAGGWLPAAYDWPGRDGETGDTAIFGKIGTTTGANADCILTGVFGAVTLASMEVNTGFARTIQLYSGLTVSGALTLQSEEAVLRGHRPSGGPTGGVGVAAPGTFTWKAGTLYDIDVGIHGNPGGTPATMSVPTATGGRNQKNSTITIGGVLNWTADSVLVPPTVDGVPKSVLTINGGGTANITGPVVRWGSDDPDRLDVTNNGTVNANLTASQTATVVGKFKNNSTVQVRAGTLALAGKAEQGGGQTELHNNGTLKLTSAAEGRKYVVRVGAVAGQGTVDGNLVLDSVAGVPAPVLSPGFGTGGFGRIIITESLDIYTDGNVQIDIGPGNQDFVEVRGYAALNGTLTVRSPVSYRPALGTQHVFMSAVGGFPRNFDSTVMPPGWIVQGRHHHWEPENSPDFYWVFVDD